MLVFVLRHCDRQPDPVDDLAPGGRERAELLARLLGESGASVAYHSGTVRAQRTLEPLQGKLGSAITVEGVASGDPQQTVEAVRSQPADAVVVVVGHSNTVGPIVEALGGPPTSPIATRRIRPDLRRQCRRLDRGDAAPIRNARAVGSAADRRRIEGYHRPSSRHSRMRDTAGAISHVFSPVGLRNLAAVRTARSRAIARPRRRRDAPLP